MPAKTIRAQDPADAEVRARIARVERGLRSVVVVDGRVRAYTLADRMKFYGVPAVSVAVVNGDRIEWSVAWGLADVEAGSAADTRTLFQAASISKPVAALAALRLVEQGRLSLDTNVNTHLRTWKVPESPFTADKPVSLRALLSHTAGMTVHGFRGYGEGEPVPTTVQVLDGVPPANSAAIRTDIEPGKRWRYSGGGFTVVQLLVADVSGTPFPQLMRETVLEPMGMTESTYEQPLPPVRRSQAATGYRLNGQPVTGKWHTYPEMAAAGLWTTPTDLARYILEVQAAHAGRSSRVISQAMARLMLSPIMGDYGLGPGVSGQGDNLRFSHGGANEGFRAQVMGFAARGQGAAVMTNSDAGATLAAELLRAIGDEYGWPDTPRRDITSVPLAPSRLREYPGTYRAASGPTARVTLEAGELVMRAWGAGAPATPLIPTAPDEFLRLSDAVVVRFTRERGEIRALEAIGQRLLRQSE
jgi:CubicO group peptidase (beta-lactamase class C family)